MVKQTGWRTFAYVGFAIVVTLAFVVLSAIGGNTVHVSTDFYAAAAQVIPVLLLAMVIRISATRDLLIASEKETEGERLQMLDRLAGLRARLNESSLEEATKELAEIDRLEDRINATLKARRAALSTDSAPAQLSEVLSGLLLATLLLGASGIGTALIALAVDPESGALCMATATSIGWVLFGLVGQEAAHYFLSGSFTN